MRIGTMGTSAGLEVNAAQVANSTAEKGASFFAYLSHATETATTEESTGVGKNSYTGFFAEIQEKRMEELREEILDEMGLTEEMLDQMDPAARGKVETIIAKEIQKRMMAQSAMDSDGEEQTVTKRMLLESVDSLTL